MAHSCPVCFKTVLSSEEGIQCDAHCSRWFHRTCLNMTKTEYRRFADDTNLKWTCDRVDCVDSSNQPQNLLLNQLTLLTSRISELTNKVDQLTSLPAKVDSLIEEVDNLNRNLTTLESRVCCSETRIEALEEKFGALQASRTTSNPEEVIAELNDRSRRSKNVMLFNLAEIQDRNIESCRRHDRTILGKLVTSYLPDIQFEAVKLLRVGKPQLNKKRPVKLIFENDRDAREFLKSFSTDSATRIDQCFSSVRAFRDRTPREMDHLNSLRTELSRRQSAGEKDLTIKFINNVPQIVKNQKNV